jgi:glyoxylase-like metal-dependent hydrolase (beta-lactamase superfamily II)
MIVSRAVWGRWLGLALAATVALPLAVLLGAHREIRGLEAELPERTELAALADVADGPQRVGYVDTATQPGYRSSPLSHPAFVLEWSDGRVFLIDAGMDPEQARAFSRPFELLLGSGPIEPHGSLARQLGPVVQRVRGMAFTHLHPDHTGGIVSLCAERGDALPVFQIRWQAELVNYTTRPGREQLEAAGCARPQRLADAALAPVPGFPGLAAIAAGGHTPGSTIYAAHVAGTTWIFAGDVTNSKRNLLENRPKPWVYSLLIVPEAPERLEALRLWLAALDAEPGFRVVVSHDRDALAASGLPRLGVASMRREVSRVRLLGAQDETQ